MTTLTHRERVLKSLNHEEADRVPVDLGGTSVTSIDIDAYGRLAEYLGLHEEVETASDPFFQRLRMAAISQTVLERFDSDCRSLALGDPEVVPRVQLSETSYRDEWGVYWERPEDGHYMNKDGPFQRIDATLADVEKHRWPEPRDPGRIRGVKERAIQLRQDTDCAICVSFPYGILSSCQRLRGFAEWFEDLLIFPALADALLEYSETITSGMAKYILEEIGEYVDVFMFPEDLGFQDRPFMRPGLYQERVKPYHKRFVEAVKSKTDAKVMIHCDGAIIPIIPDLIDIGFDVLNPIQVTAKGMEDTKRLKAEFGNDLTFWGGINTQDVMPWGTPDDVRAEVKRRIEDLAPGGGYVLGSVHNIQSDVPPENIVAMYEAALEFGPY